MIRAAGGVVWRPGRDGQPEVCLVHRKRYDDWSLPKGKRRAGEHLIATAVREVVEETGIRAVPQVRLPSVRYRSGGVPKVVDFWGMRAQRAAAFRPSSEVDQLDWLPPRLAAERVSYPHDAGLLRHWAALPPVTSVMLLVRHANAGERGSWQGGPDADRPLTAQGVAEAAALARLLSLFAPVRLVSATPRRCVETLLPLAEEPGLTVAVEPVFDEASGDAEAAAARLVELAGSGPSTVVCSQGAVIPPALAALTGQGPPSSWKTAKGDGWLLPFSGPGPLRPDRLHRP